MICIFYVDFGCIFKYLDRVESILKLSNSIKSKVLYTPIHHHPALNALELALMYASEYHSHPANLNY